MPTQLVDQPFSYFACMLISVIMADQLGSYVQNNSISFGSWFICKIRYWYNHSNDQLFIYFQAVSTKISGEVMQCQWLFKFNSNHRLDIVCLLSTWSVSIVKM